MKIAIANDSLMGAEALRRVVSGGGHTVVWIARTGADAVRLCREQRPELVLMDLNMPELDGVDATRAIMREAPCPILVVTASPETTVSRVFKALGAGALDVAATPALLEAPDGGAALLAKIRTIGKLAGGNAVTPPPTVPRGPLTHLVAIGASTGGPVALARMLAHMQPPPHVAFVVVQHIDAAFADHFACWLGEQVRMPVRTISHGSRLKGGTLLVARTNDHVRLNAQHHLHYDPNPRQLVYRPSIDVFFQSVAEYWEGPATGVLLTGMGRDGALGLMAMRQAGHTTIAQDEASSAVYGMPRAAAEIGAAQHILALDNIHELLHSRIFGHA